MANVGGARPGAGRKPGKVSAAKRDLMDLAKGHAETALQALVQIAQSSESDSARVSAANAILDRAYGKPVQGVTVGNPEGETFKTETKILDEAERFTSAIAGIVARAGAGSGTQGA